MLRHRLLLALLLLLVVLCVLASCSSIPAYASLGITWTTQVPIPVGCVPYPASSSQR